MRKVSMTSKEKYEELNALFWRVAKQDPSSFDYPEDQLELLEFLDQKLEALKPEVVATDFDTAWNRFVTHE